MDAKELGKRIQARRKHLGLRQVDVESASGISKSMVAMVERGRRAATLGTLERIATALQTTPAALLSWDLAQEMGGATESLVAYLSSKRATDEQVRRVEALARVLLEAA